MLKKELEIGGKTLSIQTGQVARQAAGSVIVTYGDTSLLVAVNAAKELREGIDFFPLQVEYRERQYAGGKIPGGFFKREARPSEKEILTSRLTDRPIRPLFPKSFRFETQVIITALSADGENPADTLAGIGASAALMVSDIPWNGPTATVRVARINGDFVVNPTYEDLGDSDLDVVVSGNNQSIVMVEGKMDEIGEATLVEALQFAHENIQKIVVLQQELANELAITKREIPEEDKNEEMNTKVDQMIGDKIPSIVSVADKQERQSSTDELISSIQEALAEDFPEQEGEIKSLIEDRFKETIRENILTNGQRLDGRTPTDIRQIDIHTSFLPRTHGSALFTRGETQSLCTLTLGSKSDEQRIDSMDEEFKKNFMLHYNFPPYCVGEVGRVGFTSRREVGHGMLAEKALNAILPNFDDFPYTIRLVSEILESNGSSSMASVCAGSLALHDSGVPVRSHVSGIAMGLVTDGERNTILSDILGVEDHYGDMDFKVAGTREGITAMQLDLKIDGISFELLNEALAQAKEGRNHILNLMEEAIAEPKAELSEFAPKILTLTIDTEKIGELIGPGGRNIKKIIADTECGVEVDDDGQVVVSGQDIEKCRDAIELVKAITMVPEVGMEFDGIVTRLMTFGAFVEFAPGREGLVHISELEWHRVERVEDVAKPGDNMKVKLIKIDDQGRLDFSRKALLPKPEGWQPPPKRDGQRRGDRQHSRGKRPFRKKRY